MTQFCINTRFNLLDNLTSMVISKITPSLILVGEGGLGKTFAIRQAIERHNLVEGQDFVFYKGYSTPRGLYNLLYDNCNKLIVFDDCDSILEDKVALNILKSALDSYEQRKISWMAKLVKGDEYPQQFDFTGQVIFISNKSKSKIDSAILSRSLVVDLEMTREDKLQRMSSILESVLPQYALSTKSEALQFLAENSLNFNLNLRTLIMVIKMRVSNPDSWQMMAKYLLQS
jgi:hypothetical protein